jgi:hypothetical protein
MKGTIEVRQVGTSAQKAQIARLVYDQDRRFAPVTPLATLNTSTTFLMATMKGETAIRAASSYEEWLSGCDKTMRGDCTVYELASSIVRSPMGGFEPLALHHVFTFARLVNIVAEYLSPEAAGKKISVIAAIAAGNDASRTNMKSIGMTEITPWPRWLDYEHRAWFPRLEKEPREPEREAVYLWFAPDAVRKFMERIEPYADGGKPLERPNEDDSSITEPFGIDLNLLALDDLKGRYGSLKAALKKIPYAKIFAPPPDLARLKKDHARQSGAEITF